MKKDKILVFIPMYNCEKQIGRVINQFTDEVQSFLTEIIILDNRSTDNSVKVAGEAIKSLKIKASLRQNVQNYNLGGSHKVAFNYAKENNFDYVIVLHGDDQGSIKDIIEQIKLSKHQQYDCLLGARFMKKSQLIGYSKFRIFGNLCFNLLISLLFFRRIYDLGSGINMYKVTSLKDNYYLKFPNSLLFNVYLLFYHMVEKMRIHFFPISWREEDQISNAKLATMTKELLFICFKYVFSRKKLLYTCLNREDSTDYTSTVISTN